MKANDLLMIPTVALGTGALTILALCPRTLDAGNETAVPAEIQKPKLLSAQGVELTLATANGKIPKAGEAPVFELKAVSFTNMPSRVCARVTMSASSPVDALSRAIRMPAAFWVDNREFTIGPGETKRVTLACGTNLPPNKFISVSVQDVSTYESSRSTAASLSQLPNVGAQVPGIAISIVALNFSTVVPAPKAELVTSR